jgi:hypothetical protein
MARSGQEVARESDYLGNVRTQTQGFTALGHEWRCSFPLAWVALLPESYLGLFAM